MILRFALRVFVCLIIYENKFSYLLNQPNPPHSIELNHSKDINIKNNLFLFSPCISQYHGNSY